MTFELSPTFHLVTPRLYISHILAPRDWEFIIALYNSDLFLKHNGKTGVDTEQKARKHIEGWISSNFQKNGHGQYLISLRSAEGAGGGAPLPGGDLAPGQAPVGMVTLMRGHYAVPDIGFALLPGHTGRGYATEAGRRMLRFATDPAGGPPPVAAAGLLPEGRGLGLAGVFGFTAPDNDHSRKVCLRLGLEDRGVYALEAFGGRESAVYAMPGMGEVGGYGIEGPRLDK